ncbi:MAG TPA: SDR family NAD(P)-dependent oxidoreductase [Dehalococcoidales bacterium]|nr:SDR family NAD(P)-dependent oxidoreductase [Dehalococcoidales bacterium]
MGELLKGRVAVVTGAGKGLGRAEAIGLAAQGAKVVVNDLGTAIDGSGASTNPADEVVKEIKKAGGEAVASYASVATAGGAESIVKTAVDSFGRIDVLVNNAGFTRDRMVYNISDEEWDSVIKTNLYGTFYCTRAACRVMRKQGYGRIINTSSHAGLGNMGQASYSAAKEGIVGLTRTVARDMGRYGVTCNAIRPVAGTRGFVDMVKKGGLKEAWAKMWGEELAEKRVKQMLELNLPEDVAGLVVYLASDKADNVNGCVFEVWHGHIGIYNDPPPVERVLEKDGRWTPEELVEAMPGTLTEDKVRELPPIFPF